MSWLNKLYFNSRCIFRSSNFYKKSIIGFRRLCTASTSKGQCRDEWENPEFAKAWSDTGHILTNPARNSQLQLLACLVEKRFKVGDRTLDIGCGSGLSSAPVLSRLPEDTEATGIDGNQAMLQLCHSNCPKLDTHEVDFKDLETFDIGQFEHIYSVQALHEVDDDTKRIVFDFAHRSTKPNGAFYILDRFHYDASNSKFLEDYKGIWHFVTSELNRDHVNNLSWEDYNAGYLEAKLDHARKEQDYIRLLTSCGFQAEILYKLFNRSLIVARPC